uniref:DedA family n=1 Tax=Chlorobium chlorochromatii (strain CaD3) TaxID=340177 RepID=Q3AT10_CHLCH
MTDAFLFLTDFILHIDSHLQTLAAEYGLWLYLVLFLIVFGETGLVVLPFLPGDSLLFAAGSLASMPNSALDPNVLFVVFFAAAVLGDTLNYHIGNKFGNKLVHGGYTRFFKAEHLEKTNAFFTKHGGKTIIIARFVPIIRTFAPFVAGIGNMPYRTFLLFNVIGAFVWVGFFCYSGYYFGQLMFVQENFKLLIIAIIAISLLPPIIEFLKHKFSATKQR